MSADPFMYVLSVFLCRITLWWHTVVNGWVVFHLNDCKFCRSKFTVVRKIHISWLCAVINGIPLHILFCPSAFRPSMYTLSSDTYLLNRICSRSSFPLDDSFRFSWVFHVTSISEEIEQFWLDHALFTPFKWCLTEAFVSDCSGVFRFRGLKCCATHLTVVALPLIIQKNGILMCCRLKLGFLCCLVFTNSCKHEHKAHKPRLNWRQTQQTTTLRCSKKHFVV